MKTRFLMILGMWVGGCGGSHLEADYIPGEPINLLDGPVHLGNDIAHGQSFPNGPAAAARICSLVSLPDATDAFINVRNVRSTETVSNQLTVNGKPFALPMTLERDPYGVTSNATTISPVARVHLDDGPSEICLVSGRKSNGDLDDFEVDQVVLYVRDFSADRVVVRRGLTLGRPPAVYPPSVPWGREQ
jgi:hypothetical protein